MGDQVVGHAGELHPRVCAALELPARTSVMELDLDALPAAAVPVGPPISAFPPVLLDLALVVADEVPAAEVAEALRDGRGGAAGVAAALRRLHRAAGAGRLAVAGVRADPAAPDRTLTSEEATAVRDAAVAAAAAAYRSRAAWLT